MKAKHVLVVSNDKANCHGLVNQLDEAGFSASSATSAQLALDKLREVRPDAILLSLNGEGVGHNFLESLRAEGEHFTTAPVIVLTSRGHEEEAVSAFDVGADDFLVKPVRPTELAARLEVVLKRATQRSEPSRAVALRAGPIFVNVDRREAYLRLDNGEIRPLRLTKREFALLVALMRRKNTMLSREELVEQAFGEGARVNPQNLGAYIHRLREKVEPDSAKPRHVVTDRGLGFKIVD